MHFENLASELVLYVFHACNTIEDVQNLASTCHRFHQLYAGSQKLPILFSAAETQYGPLQDAIQVVTQNASQPAHIIRKAPVSVALLKQLISMGKAAQQWVGVYPSKKWKSDFENRRLLTEQECYNARRAIYRLWLYSRAFHNSRFARTGRTQRLVVLERAELLHNWTSAELAEMHDMQLVIRDVVRGHVCPSNGTIQRKFRKRFPESDAQLQFNVHLNYPPPVSTFQDHFYSAHQASASGTRNTFDPKFRCSSWHEPGAEGWGDDIPHYYVVEDMMKLDPGQILWLRDNAPLKGMVEVYIKSLGEWFENNGETFGQTLEWVLGERNEEVEELRIAVEERETGIALD